METGETTLAFASNELGKFNLPGGSRKNDASEIPVGVEIALVAENVEDVFRSALEAWVTSDLEISPKSVVSASSPQQGALEAPFDHCRNHPSVPDERRCRGLRLFPCVPLRSDRRLVAREPSTRRAPPGATGNALGGGVTHPGNPFTMVPLP